MKIKLRILGGGQKNYEIELRRNNRSTNSNKDIDRKDDKNNKYQINNNYGISRIRFDIMKDH